nr:immunoglobulin heavy chain junction region [Mus musculus]
CSRSTWDGYWYFDVW